MYFYVFQTLQDYKYSVNVFGKIFELKLDSPIKILDF